MKKSFLIITFIISLFIFGCSKENFNAEEHLDIYIDFWKKSDFTSMYELLTEEAKDEYDTDAFITRYEKIYQDLKIKDVEITYPEWTEEQEDVLKKERQINIPLDVSMTSLAGEIEFTYDITVHAPKEADEEWRFDWDPGLIFPGLANGGKIKIETLHPNRGEISDRNKIPLAMNDTAYEIGVVPSQFENEEAEIEQLANLLNLSVTKIKDTIEAPWVQPEHFVPLKLISNQDEDKLTQLTSIPAVKTAQKTGRVYPSGKASAHLTGYVGQITAEEIKNYPEGTYSESDFIGKQGLEKIYEERLRGQEGKQIIIEEKNDSGATISTTLAETPVKHGENIQLTIDINLQEKIFSSYDKIAGTAAAVNPKTGEVLALVSAPAFDPNELAYGVSQKRWDELINDKQLPFLNRFTATYAPGSVFKPLVAAIGLENGTIKPNETLHITGLTWNKQGWGDVRVKRVSTGSSPDVDIKDAMMRSDNIYFAQKGIAMGEKAFSEGLKKFGFGENLPFPYTIKKSQIANDDKISDEVLLAHSSYGQGEVEVSSLHMALSYTSFVNGGKIIQPVLTKDEQTGKTLYKDVISQENANNIQDYLRAVITGGTGTVGNDKKFAISGKTGTAELKQSLDSKGHENGWFVGYPTEKQDVVLAIMMEHTENHGTSTLATKHALDILKSYNKMKK